jgi:glycosyltransferase involved in cell wall biosynthesis
LPDVSVCIRAYRRPHSLVRSIGSVLAQTHDDFEVIVADDSGELGGVVNSVGDLRVRYFRNPERLGPARNLSRAIGLARGDYIAILNDDDRFEPDFLARTVEVLDHHRDVGVVFTDDYFEAGTRWIRRRLPYTPGRHDRFLREVLEHSIPVSAVVMRRTVWDQGEEARPIAADMVGDLTTWLRAASAGWPFYYIDEPLGISAFHPGQVSWSETNLASRIAKTFLSFEFDDPVCELLRRSRASEFLLARANLHLRQRRLRSAAADVRQALAVDPQRFGARSLLALAGVRPVVARYCAAHPRLLAAVLLTWRRIRPPVQRQRPWTAVAADTSS